MAGTSTWLPSFSFFALPICSLEQATGCFTPCGTRGEIVAALWIAYTSWIAAINVNSLLTVRTQFQYRADVTRAIIELAIEHEGEPWLDPNAGLDLMPSAGDLPAFVDQHGSPLEDAYFPSVVPVPQQQAYDDARLYLARDE